MVERRRIPALKWPVSDSAHKNWGICVLHPPCAHELENEDAVNISLGLLDSPNGRYHEALSEALDN